MENQHRHIQGYRELSEEEIAGMNRIKEMSAGVGELCISLREAFQSRMQPNAQSTVVERAEYAEALRWLEAGELQLQQGFMAITRSIARPTTF